MPGWPARAGRVATAVQRAFGQPAIYRLGGSGYGVVLTVVLSGATERAAWSGLQAQGPAWWAELLMSAVPFRPAKSDTIEIGTSLYEVAGKPEQDADVITWRLPLHLVGEAPTMPVLALTIPRTGDDIPVESARIWDWSAGQNVAIGGTESVLSAVVDANRDRLVRVQADVVCWVRAGSSTPVAVRDGAGCTRLTPGRPEELVIQAGHKVAAICAPGLAGRLELVPAA